MTTTIDTQSQRKERGLYMAFETDTSDDTARAAFIKRFGVEPERVFLMYPARLICAGPVPAANPQKEGEK